MLGPAHRRRRRYIETLNSTLPVPKRPETVSGDGTTPCRYGTLDKRAVTGVEEGEAEGDVAAELSCSVLYSAQRRDLTGLRHPDIIRPSHMHLATSDLLLLLLLLLLKPYSHHISIASPHLVSSLTSFHLVLIVLIGDMSP